MREEIHALSMTTLTPAQWDGAQLRGQAAIEGGRPLAGEVRVSGAKNAALPILCAALLSREPLTLSNVARLNDVRTMQTLLAQMGVRSTAARRARSRSTQRASTGRWRRTSS